MLRRAALGGHLIAGATCNEAAEWWPEGAMMSIVSARLAIGCGCWVGEAVIRKTKYRALATYRYETVV